MARVTLAAYIVLLGLLIGLLHILAMNFFLYWDIAWFDILMHFLGGFWVALLGLWILALLINIESFTLRRILYVSVFFTLGIGIIWEVFEFGAGLSFVGPEGWPDTILDLIMDMVGGLTAGFYVWNRISKSKDA